MKYSLKCPAKINLFLKILGKRRDNFHEIQTLMSKISLYDELELVVGEADAFSLSCKVEIANDLAAFDPDIKEKLSGGDNLVLKISNLFFHELEKLGQREFLKYSFNFNLLKNIPIGAGLGGGSSDAASALLLLNKFFNEIFSRKELIKIASNVGSDIPFFVENSLCYALGRGEKLYKVETGDLEQDIAIFPQYLENFVLVKPHFSVSTETAYSSLNVKGLDLDSFDCIESASSSLSYFSELIFGSYFSKSDFNFSETLISLNKNLESFESNSRAESLIELNDFHKALLRNMPEYRNFIDALSDNGTLEILLCGSGSTVACFFRNLADLEKFIDFLGKRKGEFLFKVCDFI